MNLWHPQATPELLNDRALLVALLRPFACVRFMDWMQTNNSTARTLDDLLQPYTYSGGKWTPEHRVDLATCIDIANAADLRGWYCVPHLADEREINKIVQYIIHRSERRPIIEWSNETWNAQFSQHTTDMQHIINRLRVIAESTEGRADVTLGLQFWNPDAVGWMIPQLAGVVTVVSVAPYVGRRMVVVDAAEIAREIREDAQPLIVRYVDLCRQSDLSLYAYEGGWHGHARDDATADMMCEYVRSNAAAYDTRRLWHVWRSAGGELFAPYALAAQHGRQQWGHVEIVGRKYRLLPRYFAAF